MTSAFKSLAAAMGAVAGAMRGVSPAAAETRHEMDRMAKAMGTTSDAIIKLAESSPMTAGEMAIHMSKVRQASASMPPVTFNCRSELEWAELEVETVIATEPVSLDQLRSRYTTQCDGARPPE